MEQAEKLVNAYNRNLAADLDLLDRAVDGIDGQETENRRTIDRTHLHGRSQGAATDQAVYLVDMARAEALDAIGETERAAQLLVKHI